MLAVSVSGDAPPNDLQPPLPDGIHLRWGSPREVAFPWYGYYLLRREHGSQDKVAIGADIGQLAIGAAGSTRIDLPQGRIESDAELAVTDDFPPPAGDQNPEIDLRNRGWVRFVPKTFAMELEVVVSFLGDAEIEVQASFGPVPILRRTVKGRAGTSATASFAADAISAVEVASGPAVITAISYVALEAGATAGWQTIKGVPYPLTLPVSHPDYPAPGKPASQADAEQAAHDRVLPYAGPTYPRPDFASLHTELSALVDGGPNGGRMAAKSVKRPSAKPPPQMVAQSPLDLVLLGSLHPPIAQMVGLYWNDASARRGTAYDYLVIADHKGVMAHLPRSASLDRDLPDWINSQMFEDVDAFIVFDRKLDDPAPPLEPPGELRGYVLPGGIRPPSARGSDADSNVGLTWDRGREAGTVLPGRAVLYHVWREALGTDATPAARAKNQVAITQERPVFVAEPTAAAAAVPRPADWPPASIPLHHIDTGLEEGWYSYEVNGIDLFGRHSVASPPSSWRQWSPRPEPRPWYYLDPPAAGDAEVHPYAIGLLDKTGPPPPTAIEAYALDPDDPMVVRDAAYDAWQATLTLEERESLVGLRVGWTWTARHMEQAPDAKEFRIYLQPGTPNSLLGRVASVAAAGATESEVVVTMPNARSADAYAGARLLVGNDAFAILASKAGSPVALRVRNVGPQSEVRPATGRPCTVAIPEGHALFEDRSEPSSWPQRLHVVDLAQSFTTIGSGPDRRYEVFLPASGGAALGLGTSAAEPIARASVTVATADDKGHTSDDPKWAGSTWGGRTGNEGPVGGTASIFVVKRTPPDAPEVPPSDAEAVYASPADYHGKSYFSFRWIPAADHRTHVLRALDETLFATHLALPASRRPALDPAGKPEHRKLFPKQSAEPRWDDRRCAQVAGELNALGGLATYRALSNDAIRVLAGLPGTEAAFTQLTIQPLDPDDPANADRRGRDDPSAYKAQAGLRVYEDALDGRSSNRYLYRAAYVDGVHNRGALSLSGPPVRMPDVMPPRAPVVTRVLGGDRKVTLAWASNREADLKEYRVYRAESEDAARDVRLMDLVGTVAAATPRPAEVQLADTGLIAARPLHYRVVAVDSAGNRSDPSDALRAMAYEGSAPDPATWTTAQRSAAGTGAQLEWYVTYPQRCLVIARRTDLSLTETVVPWGEGSYDAATKRWTFRTAVEGLDKAHKYELTIVGRTAAGHETRAAGRVI